MDQTTYLTLNSYEEKLHLQKTVATIGAVVLMLIDQLIYSAYGMINDIAFLFTGFVMAALILTGYKIKDHNPWIIGVWSVVAYIIMNAMGLIEDKINLFLYFKSRVVLLNVIIYGYLTLLTVMKFVKLKRLPRIRWYFFALWLVMVLGMMYSINDDMWPMWFLFMFGCFTFVEYNEDEVDAIVNGVVNGILIGFVLIQGMAWLYRPFCKINNAFRYEGMTSNSNINALFYLIACMAAFTKLYALIRNRKFRIYNLLFPILICAITSLAIFTGCRTAIIMMLCMIALFSILLLFTRHLLHFLLVPLIISAMTISVFAVTFSLTQKVPFNTASFLTFNDDDVKVFGPEQVTNNNVIQIEIDSLKDGIIKRLRLLLPSKNTETTKHNHHQPFTITAHASTDTLKHTLFYRDLTNLGSGDSKEDPVLTGTDATDSFMIRYGIFKTFIDKINFSGHTEQDFYFYLTKSYKVPHAHNNFIQILYLYGWIPGVTLIILLLSAIHFYGICIFFKGKQFSTFSVFYLLFIIICFTGFGMFDRSCYPGQISLVMLFLINSLSMQKGKTYNAETDDDIRLQAIHI